MSPEIDYIYPVPVSESNDPKSSLCSNRLVVLRWYILWKLDIKNAIIFSLGLRSRRYRHNFFCTYDSPMSLPDRIKIWLTSVHPSSPNSGPKSPTPLLTWASQTWQIVAEWLEIAYRIMVAMESLWGPPSLFRMVPSLIPYDRPPLPQMGGSCAY